MKLRLVLLIVVCATSLLAFSTAAAYARTPYPPANDIERGVFVDPVPGKVPPARGKPGGGLGELNTTYSYKGVHWANPVVHYEVNPDASGLSPLETQTAIDNAFWSWQTEYNVLGRADQSYIFFVDDAATTAGGPALDGHNVIAWAPLSSGTLAATYYWFDRRTKHLIEFDMVFNTMYPWSLTGEAGKYDTRNIATHEAGHTLQLGDLYGSSYSELTMYGYGAAGETKKQTLGLGDMLGAENIYPTP